MSTSALACVPMVCNITAAGGKSKHKLVNQCGVRLAYKVKCSNNGNYMVNPVFGFVEVGDQGELEITRKPGKPKADKLVIQFSEAPADMSDAKLAFEPSYQSPFSGEFMVKLSAAE
ncbi:MSP domain-containing protein [Aphelenchoides besseyi]|nr:MSP domain-containing protein [Aphelenchoides besseyi]KAI6219358.1 MSP domain-containing protein [Aphelenchoides besseyi]